MQNGMERPGIQHEISRFNKCEAESKLLNYGHLSRALELTLEIFSSYDGVRFLLDKRQEAIANIMNMSGDKIKGIFSTGYPNYVIPEIDMPTSATALTEEQFEPVPEILEYVSKTLNKAKDHNLEEQWPCPDCHASLKLQSLRPTDHECIAPVTPFHLYTTIPDIDLYIVVEKPADAKEVEAGFKEAGLNIAENQLVDCITKFPGVINIDPHFVMADEFMAGLQKITSDADSWFESIIPTLHYRGKLVEGKIHFGLDFAFSLISHIISDPEMARAYFKARNKFVMNRSSDEIVRQTKSTKESQNLPRRIGRLVTDYTKLESQFRARLKAYREFGAEASTPDSGFIITDSSHPEALFELYQEISDRENLVHVVDESLLPFLGEYAPSFVADLNQAIGSDYPHNPNNVFAEKAVRLSMAHNALDNILFEGNATPELLTDRLLRLKEVAEYVGLSTEGLEEYLQGTKSHTYAEATYFTKQLSFKLYNFFAKTPEGNQVLSTSQNEYPFINSLRELFGDNLQNIILYGSSTNLRKGNDYDLLVIVDDISEQLYVDLENKQKEINSHSDRDVQLIIVPKKDLQAYLSGEGMTYDSTELVYGSEITIPVFANDITQYVAIPANKIIRSLESMQKAFKEPEYYIQKPQVLRGHLKLPKHLIDAYSTLYGKILPREFFDQLQEEFQIPNIDEVLSPEKVKELRNKAIHDLFTIAKKISQELSLYSE